MKDFSPFKQAPSTYKVSFVTKYECLNTMEELFSSFFHDDTLTIVTSEVETTTIDPQPEDKWRFEAYLNVEPDIQSLKFELEKFSQQNNIPLLSDIDVEIIRDADWVSQYQANLKPIEIGPFYISSRSNKNAAPMDKIGIFIDAARAFGTGDHATTAGCVNSMLRLQHLVRPSNTVLSKPSSGRQVIGGLGAENRSVFDIHEDLSTRTTKQLSAELGLWKDCNILDVGCGTGILALAAEKLFSPAKVIGCDIDETAVKIAIDNAKFNNSNATFYKNSEDEVLLPEHKGEKFNLIISNILANPLIEMAPIIKDLATPDAYVILSGFLESQKALVLDAYEKQNFQEFYTEKRNGWAILTLRVNQS